ncbi:cytidine deaminase [Thauera sinica]|uniref:Cytidine deaminase n=1 Tax=Thauera sinica TaxID=2665146 RepID=A0ABW1AT55_9RHOO|nr:cytidine deaminase [Thauera sp. K11]
MTDGLTAFEHALARFPDEAADLLRTLPDRRGAIPAAEAERLGELLGTDRRSLMIALLPVAAAFAHPAISAFAVGAVAAGRTTPDGRAALYLGANFEVGGEFPTLSVHAEQAAAAHAWLAGETGLSALAASSPPCGHCRQFLYELEDAQALEILSASEEAPGYRTTTLARLLPDAFGPHILGIAGGFMANRGSAPRLVFDEARDAVREAALQAASASYAPYTGAFAGCALQTADGGIVVGRTVENAAHNPGLSAAQMAFSAFNAGPLRGDFTAIRRVVLVEHATMSSQAALAERCAHALAPWAAFECCRARLASMD